MKKLTLTAIAAAALVMTGCSDHDAPQAISPQPSVIPAPIPDWEPASLKSVAQSNTGKANGFAIELFKKTMENGDDNLCLSPVSVFAALAMSANGDSGETRNEILSILGYGDGDLSSLNLFCNALMTETTALTGGTECAYSNSFWYRPDLRPCETFLSTIHAIYNADIFNTWLGDERGMLMANDYISQNTRGLIPQFLPMPLNVSMALINTTYFKGEWKVRFDKNLTTSRAFHNLDGTTSDTQLMCRQDNIDCAVTQTCISARLPYLGDRYTLTLIMPTKGSDFSSMLNELNPSKLRELDDLYQDTATTLSMPRFETSVSIDLLEQLQAMGLNLGCSRGFDNICPGEKYFIRVVKHGVKLIVNEDGTEAAGATLVGMDNCVAPGFTFDHPFIYLIRDTISDTILFIGAVTKF